MGSLLLVKCIEDATAEPMVGGGPKTWKSIIIQRNKKKVRWIKTLGIDTGYK